MTSIISSNILILVNTLMFKDPSSISNVLSLLTKMFEKYENKDKNYENEKIKEIFCEM